MATGATAAGSGFADFVASARATVEAEAAHHADDRFWVLEPALIVVGQDGELELQPLGDHEHAAEALALRGLRGQLAALGERRAGVALHVDLAVDDDLFSAIVLSVAGSMAASSQYARVERDQAGLPRLGPWTVAPEIEDDLVAAVRRTLGA
jgi:hypothetical protein